MTWIAATVESFLKNPLNEEQETSCRSNEDSEVFVISSNLATPDKQHNLFCHAGSRVILKWNIGENWNDN